MRVTSCVLATINFGQSFLALNLSSFGIILDFRQISMVSIKAVTAMNDYCRCIGLVQFVKPSLEAKLLTRDSLTSCDDRSTPTKQKKMVNSAFLSTEIRRALSDHFQRVIIAVFKFISTDGQTKDTNRLKKVLLTLTA